MAEIFDVAGALDRVDDDKELLGELIDIFFEEFETQMAQLETGLSSGDAKEIEKAAHSMKSALGNIGAMKAFEQAYAVESLGRNAELANAQAQIEALFEFVAEFKNVAFEYKKGL